MYVYMADFLVHQKLTQHCKAIILQLKKNNTLLESRGDRKRQREGKKAEGNMVWKEGEENEWR